MIPPLSLQTPDNQETEKLQSNVKNFVTALENNPLLDGDYLENIDLVGGVTTVINHRLGRQIRGWIICDLTGGAAITSIRRPLGSVWNNTQLALAANFSCTINLWVF